MIKSFRHKGLKNFFLTGSIKGINPEHAQRINRILTQMNRSSQIDDMGLPGFKLHALKGDLNGLWAVTVSGNYRITFEFKEGHAYILNYQDYH